MYQFEFPIHQPGTSGWIAEYHDNLGDENGLWRAKGNDWGTFVYGGNIAPMVEGGVGGPSDRLLGVGDGGPSLRLWGPGDGAPKLILESESSLRVGLWDVSLHLRGLPDILLLPLPDWCRECAKWAAVNCWCCCNLEQRKQRIQLQRLCTYNSFIKLDEYFILLSLLLDKPVMT